MGSNSLIRGRVFPTLRLISLLARSPCLNRCDGNRLTRSGVIAWFAAQPDEMLFISVLTLGELRRGILKLAAGRKRRDLLRWLETEIEPVLMDGFLASMRRSRGTGRKFRTESHAAAKLYQ
jgi:hypothetical protein